MRREQRASSLSNGGRIDSEFGQLRCEARVPLWLAGAMALVLVTLLGISIAVLITQWPELSWLARGVFIFSAIGVSYALADGLIRRVQLFERGLVQRSWNGRARRLEYSQVKTILRGADGKVRIYPYEGGMIQIFRSEGDLDGIVTLVEQTAKESQRQEKPEKKSP